VEVAFTVLIRGAVAHAIEEDGFQALELGAAEGRSLIDDDTAELLARAGAHHPGLLVADREAFFERDRAHARREPAERPLERSVAGEREVVGVARVRRAEARGEAGEPAVHRPRRGARQR